ncbi:MAG: T9SS type A sorting domain-containing protein [Bacteroidales bacterium]
MRNLIIFLLFIPFTAFCQPEGKLFVHSGLITNNVLGCIQFPQNQYVIIDTTNLEDMKIINNKLYVSNDKVFIYNVISNQKIDTILTSSADLIGNSSNFLVVTRSEAPFFEVYNLITKNLIFSLDTNKVKAKVVDLLVDMNRAYLLYDTSVQVIDLNLQDTVKTLAVVYNSWFPTYNTHLINSNSKIYINVGIATGAPRFAIISLDKTSLAVENVLFQEFVEVFYEPIYADNKLYMSSFPSHYDIQTDTFKYFQYNPNTYPLFFDEFSNTFFLYKPNNFEVSYYSNNSYSNGVVLPTYLNKTVYYSQYSIGIAKSDEAKFFRVYPNPANNELNISLPAEKLVKGIRIVSLNGNNYVNIQNSNMMSRKIDISNLKDGIYFVEIQCDDMVYKSKFIKVIR